MAWTLEQRHGSFDKASVQALHRLLAVLDVMNDDEIYRITSWATGQDDFPSNPDKWIGIYAGVAEDREKRENDTELRA